MKPVGNVIKHYSVCDYNNARGPTNEKLMFTMIEKYFQS